MIEVLRVEVSFSLDDELLKLNHLCIETSLQTCYFHRAGKNGVVIGISSIGSGIGMFAVERKRVAKKTAPRGTPA